MYKELEKTELSTGLKQMVLLPLQVQKKTSRITKTATAVNY